MNSSANGLVGELRGAGGAMRSRDKAGASMATRRFLNSVMRFALGRLTRIHVSGVENVPRSGRLILMFNHINFLDAPAASAFFPREVVVMTKMENFKSFILAPLMYLYGCFPVRRGEVDRGALRKAMRVLNNDKVFLISPEGTRSRGKGLGKGRDGMVLIALRSGAPIIPVAVWGVEKVVPAWRRMRAADVHIQYGVPFRLSSGDGKVNRDEVREMTAEAMYLLSSMLPASYRGKYADIPTEPHRYIVSLDGGSYRPVGLQGR